ncbi:MULTISPECIES: AEC family transporter [unclassified Oceanobacter]|jgi:predicted permease|uniref:AEC family transporter n=1 Tax=unclassified Oceanobacter TaxID=2620260 RepID=UPI0026E32025|nr:MULTISPECIES: AEC family transporter [unclassified Oceanobacter]MDO6682482.1 AEC family transporter [Oceanobacter sp. 5_MG-2023]MDP2506428.1 AEC family transporter [Oceanobacter sp. 3_MG-2023]MDP2548765.1 AEC family transporter [Oceanobacter sp. 4_MG-2023]MDP2609190.1 AEC family transporter [Oceanobacter sp. 1_MG-2023]MDP2612518.1 AEC family transporter [Oceanobacter sp. 2_MG-2023]
MSILIDTVFPIFLIILVGFLAGKFRICGGDAAKVLNDFVFWFAMPCLLFKAMVVVDPAELLNLDYLILIAISAILTMAVGVLMAKYLLGKRLDSSALLGLNAAYGNTGYLGIPLAFASFGDAASVPVILYVVVGSLLTVTIAIIMIELDNKVAASPAQITMDIGKAVCKNPMLLSPLAGILYAMLPVELPSMVFNFCDMLGDAAGPCALFSLGLFLVGKPLFGDISAISTTALLKLLGQPLLTWFLASYVFSLSPLWTSVAILMASTPTGAGSFVLAQKYNIFVQETSTTIIWTSMVSLFTISWVLSSGL